MTIKVQGCLCQPSGPDGEGQAEGQARSTRSEPLHVAQLSLVLEVAPVVVQVAASGLDWPAIIASISTGVAAVAGIGGTLWQANHGSKHYDKRAQLNEKRRIYAAFLVDINEVLTAAMKDKVTEGTSGHAEADAKYNESHSKCMSALFELTLIAPKNVTGAAMRALAAMNNLVRTQRHPPMQLQR